MEKGLEKEAAWIPATPDKPIPAMNSLDWEDFSAVISVDESISFKKTPAPQASAGASATPQLTNLHVDDRPFQETFWGNESNKLHIDQSSPRSVGPASTPVSTVPEARDTKKRRNSGVELNKRPRQRPKVKRHRPKVVVDGKSSKTPKSSTFQPQTPKISQPKPGKSKRSLKASAMLSKVVEGQAFHRSPIHAAKSCARALNFDFEKRQEVENDFGETVNCKILEAMCKDANSTIDDVDKQEMEQNPEYIGKSSQQDLHLNLGAQAPEEKNFRRFIHQYQRRRKSLEKSSSPLQVDQTIIQCSMDSRRLGPNFPSASKKTRKKRRKAITSHTFRDCRELGPNFPRAFKKTRKKRQKASMSSTSWHIIAKEDCHRDVMKVAKKSPMRKVTVSKFTSRMTPQNRLKGVNNVPMQKRLLHMISPAEEHTRAAIDDPESFKCALVLHPMVKSKRKRSTGRIQRRMSFAVRDLNHIPLPTPTDITPLPLTPAANSYRTHFSSNLAFQYPVRTFLPSTSALQIYNRTPSPSQQVVANGIPKDKEDAPFPTEGCPPEYKGVLPTAEKSSDDPFVRQLIDLVVQKLECLHISDECCQLVVRDQDANAALVPYTKKKRQSLPKVELEPETRRVWKQLTENDGSEVVEEVDKEKEKWWEEQREVFRGRVDSFNARMHLIQGDRRFSPWKGSVVDSVVGVFLTQNVSDHLSSSAFMSLAAKFPLKSTSNHEECDNESEFSDSPESIGSNTCEDGKACDTNGKQSFAYGTEQAMREQFSEFQEGNLATGTRQENSDQAEESTETSAAFLNQNFESVHQCGVSPGCSSQSELIAGESLLSNNGTGDGKHRSVLESLPNLNCETESVRQCQVSPSCSSKSEPIAGESLLSSNGTEDGKHRLVLESLPDLNCETESIQEYDTPRAQEAIAVEPENLHSSNNYQGVNKESEATPKKGRRKFRKIEENTVDWDELRRTYAPAARNTAHRTMDSVDWEGVRCATLEEVAETIKKRGMNNLLAEHIKSFLDRIYKAHGSLDLEWLREVPPEKAKAYLLGIDRLGLKSVECVRLLTLHHHAFPVDTNVGRVAVRLGWVPLQPLPEGVQIHLLKQYPLLDTIQQYLWTRLCTLDQKTFAKRALPRPKEEDTSKSPVPSAQSSDVVVTPLTLAHSRLNVSDSAYQTRNGEPQNISLLEHNVPESGYQTQNCEPIIEVPASPEPENTEDRLRDIEDFYLESDDDIPTIKLNSQEFIETLQNYIDINYDLVHGNNTSNALVPLSWEAASIPAPKLINVGRLRTVHQVYELPDSHPLVAGLSKREKGDPCPYLFAMWTPGKKSTYDGSFIECPEKGRNIVFADDESSKHPISVPRAWLWNLRRRSLYCGTSATTIFK
ncbi:hypothetical protein RJ640_021214, partial [Escallonia rubra]